MIEEEHVVLSNRQAQNSSFGPVSKMSREAAWPFPDLFWHLREASIIPGLTKPAKLQARKFLEILWWTPRRARFGGGERPQLDIVL